MRGFSRLTPASPSGGEDCPAPGAGIGVGYVDLTLLVAGWLG